MVKQTAINKGSGMEELLRAYFLKAGYYVVRGVPFIYEGFDVTDIDLWLYGRASSLSREVTIVDSKNKKTPQAIERIFWVQGLKEATKATNAVVATTDKRQEVRDFGKQLNVMVLDGAFLARLGNSDGVLSERIADEEFWERIDGYSLGKLDGDWKGRLRKCKSLLSRFLSFDSCNEWLSHAKFFAEQSVTKPSQQEVALRCCYLICSFIAVAVDYSLRELSFIEQTQRTAILRDGFTYGSKGSAGMERIMNVAMGLVEQHAPKGSAIASQVRSNVNAQFQKLNSIILAEYFSKNDVAKNLFNVAREFEQLAMQRTFVSHTAASVDLRGMLLCLLDYWGIDRMMFSEPA